LTVPISATRSVLRRFAALLVLGAALSSTRSSAAQTPEGGVFVPQFLGAQFTVIGQALAPFPALYRGPNSLTSKGDVKATHTYGLYFGVPLPARLEAYADLEMARGYAVGNAVGLAGITNGDVIRQGSIDLGQGPYVARAFLRYNMPLSRELDTAARAMDQLPRLEPAAQFEVKLGKLAATDDFDQNRYANSTRTQFTNWALFNNSAWDYAADTRGYSFGLLLAWIEPRWALRVGSYYMPTFANGNVFDTDIRHARGDNVELTVQPTSIGTVFRLLAYVNHGRMGSYGEALARAQASGAPLNVSADDHPGRIKYGLGLNVEQPLADGGETGAFLRLGWNDGRTEDFVFTEVDRHFSAGAQLAGSHWGRSADRLGLALVLHGLSPLHEAYLARGGTGFLLGDGALNYGFEEILETYYRFQLGHYVELGPGFQAIEHPGYNRDRGPAVLGALRLNVRY
jgi:high affinity Mn2+ porin